MRTFAMLPSPREAPILPREIYSQGYSANSGAKSYDLDFRATSSTDCEQSHLHPSLLYPDPFLVGEML